MNGTLGNALSLWDKMRRVEEFCPLLKFRFSKEATKIDEMSILDLTFTT